MINGLSDTFSHSFPRLCHKLWSVSWESLTSMFSFCETFVKMWDFMTQCRTLSPQYKTISKVFNVRPTSVSFNALIIVCWGICTVTQMRACLLFLGALSINFIKKIKNLAKHRRCFVRFCISSVQVKPYLALVKISTLPPWGPSSPWGPHITYRRGKCALIISLDFL